MSGRIIFFDASGNQVYVAAATPLPTTLLGSNLQENPHGTRTGQSVVSISEDFWTRFSRFARQKELSFTGQSIGNTGAWAQVTGTTVSAAPGFMYYPKEVLFSANIDCELALFFQTKIKLNNITNTTTTDGMNQYSGGFYATFLKAFTPYVLRFNGDLYADWDVSPIIQIQARTATAGGLCTGYILGYEVAKNA